MNNKLDTPLEQINQTKSLILENYKDNTNAIGKNPFSKKLTEILLLNDLLEKETVHKLLLMLSEKSNNKVLIARAIINHPETKIEDLWKGYNYSPLGSGPKKLFFEAIKKAEQEK